MGSAMNWTSALVSASFAGLLLVSVPGKFNRAPGSSEVAARDRIERKATDILIRSGYTPAGMEILSVDGLYRISAFQHPDCVGFLRVAAVPANGEAGQILDRLR